MSKKSIVFGILYLGSILVANALVYQFGIVSIGWLSFPAGAVMVGISFSLRDIVQDYYGKWKSLVWMLIALIITLPFSNGIVIASATAFILSECIDWSIYTYVPISRRNRMLMSNLVSIPVDSLVFVYLLYGFQSDAIIGQAIVKFVSGCIVIVMRRNKNI